MVKQTAKQILEKVSQERSSRKQALEEREKANKFYHRLHLALTKTRTRKVEDPITHKHIGMRFKYTEDGNGKSIYDYLFYNNDPFEQKLIENLNIKIDPNDPKDGSWVDKPIKLGWLNRNY